MFVPGKWEISWILFAEPFLRLPYVSWERVGVCPGRKEYNICFYTLSKIIGYLSLD